MNYISPKKILILLPDDDILSEKGISDIEEEKGNEKIKIEVPFEPENLNIKGIPRNIRQLVELLEGKQILIFKYSNKYHYDFYKSCNDNNVSQLLLSDIET